MKTLYSELVAARVPVDHHESDLYFKATPDALDILERYPDERRASRYFVEDMGDGWWIEVPFSFDPFWAAKKTA